MLNAFPLPAFSLHVKLPGVSISFQLKKTFQIAETLLAFLVPDRFSLLASRDLHLSPPAALNFCKHWGAFWRLALNLSFSCSSHTSLIHKLGKSTLARPMDTEVLLTM